MDIKFKWLYVFLAINIFSVVYYILYFIKFNHTPSPFVYDKGDTFMDFFNTLYWAYDANRYSTWQSIYPPLNFLFLKFVNLIISGGIYTEPFDMRHNGQYLISFIVISFMMVPIIILKSYDWVSIWGKICVYLIFILSAPFLFALERGNLIVYALPILYLFFNSEKLSKVLYLSILVNIKPYFGLLIIPDFLKKNYYEVLIFIFISASIYILTSMIIGSEFLGFIKNLFLFNENIFSLRELMSLPSSILAHTIFFSHVDVSLISDNSHIKNLFLSILYFGYILLLFLFFYTVIRFRKKLCHKELLCLFIIGLTNFFYQIGGYSIILYFIIIPYLYKNYRFLVYLIMPLFLPLDLVPIFTDILYNQNSYLYGGITDVYYTLGIGSIIRPILNYLLLFFMCIFIIQKFTNNNMLYIGKLNEK